MKTLVGFVLVMVGIVIIVFGMYRALSPVFAMYQEAMTDPMGTGSAGANGAASGTGQGSVLDSASGDVPAQMFRGIAIGAVGLVPLVIGSVLIKIAVFQRLARARSRIPLR